MLRNIKTFKLWKILTATEKKKLRFVINNRKNSRQKNLLQFLEKNEKKLGNVSKPDLYKRVFNSTYRKEDDFRLRNEFRLFNVLIEEVIAQESLITSRPKLHHELYLKELMIRGLTDMGESELNEAIAEARQAGDIHAAYRYTLVLLDHKFEYTKMKREEYLQLRRLLVDTVFLQATTYHEFKAMLDVKIAYAERVLLLFDQWVLKVDTRGLNINHANLELSLRTQYDRIKYHFYDPDPDVRLQAMEDALDFLERHPDTRVNLAEERIKTRMHIATVLTAKERFTDALAQYEMLSVDIPKVGKPMQSAFFFNYMATLARLNKYDEAIRKIEEHPYLLKDVTIRERFICIYISLHILSGRWQDAAKHIPENLKEGEEDTYFYLRLAWAVIQYGMGHKDIAHNEIKNLLKLLKKSTLQVPALLETADLFERFIRCSANKKLHTKSQAVDKQNEIVRQAEEMMVRWGNFHQGSLLQVWLAEHISQHFCTT